MANIIPYLLTDFQETSIVPHNAMQKFVIDKQQNNIGYGIFGPSKGARQEIIKYNFVSGGTSTPISKLTIKGYTDPNTGATINPGHCESFEIYHDGGQTYFLMATKASASGNYGTQLTRVPASLVDQGATVTYHDLLRIGSMNHVGSSSSWGTPDRLELALDSAEANLALWSFAPDTTSHIAIYSMANIKSLFNDAAQSSTNEVTIAGTPYTNSSTFGGYTKKAMFQVQNTSGNAVSGCSLQGFAMTNAGSAYVGCEAHIGDPLSNYGAKSIWKFKIGADNSGTPKNFTNGHWTTYTKEQNYKGAGVEMEGLQIVGGDLYMTVAYHKYNGSTVETEKNRLYHFDKTLV